MLLQCAVRAVLGTNVRPPVGTPVQFPMASLLLWCLAVCRNAFGTPSHSCSRSLAFCLRSLFAFGMSAFVFGWCFRAGYKPPCIHVFRSTCIFPCSCAVVTLCEDFCRCPCAHTQCARDCESSLCTLPAVSTALFYRSVYSIAECRLQSPSCTCGCSYLECSGCDRDSHRLPPRRPPSPRYAPRHIPTVCRAGLPAFLVCNWQHSRLLYICVIQPALRT